MPTLKFAEVHNLVVFLSKPTEYEGFEQIVDFLNVNPIKYALTVNPTVYKAVNKEMDDSLERAAIIATSLDVELNRGNISKNQSKATPNEPGSQGTILGGGPSLKGERGQELIDLKDYIRLDYQQEWNPSEDEGLGEEDASKQGSIADIDSNEDIYLVNVHKDKDIFGVNDSDGDEVTVEDAEILFDVADYLKGEEVCVSQEVPFKDVSVVDDVNVVSTATTTTSINDDITLAKALTKIKSAKTKTTTASTRPKAKGLVIYEQEQAPTPTVSSQKPSQKVKDDKEFKELKKCLEIISDDGDDVTIDATPLSSKSLTIVDYKIYKERKKNYFQIFRDDGNSQIYLIFSKMLKIFDREDLEVLWRLVKARFEKVKPVDHMDSFLLHNLKTMFEHHVEDNV
nr:hypothetical protein [Tanacetum cinerariifolium]